MKKTEVIKYINDYLTKENPFISFEVRSYIIENIHIFSTKKIYEIYNNIIYLQEILGKIDLNELNNIKYKINNEIIKEKLKVEKLEEKNTDEILTKLINSI